MITAALFALFRVVLTGLDALLPNWSLPDLSSWAQTLETKVEATSALRFVSGANHYLPIKEFVTISALTSAVWAAVLVYQFVVWTLTKMHVMGGS